MDERPYDRVVPLIVASALFMENMDSTVIATALPAIARALGTNPLALKLAVTSYLLSLAICIPASGWTADRFGARNVFRIAIAIFVLGSIGCAASRSLEQFVFARIVQGMGGAMMTPVERASSWCGSIDKKFLLNAMSLVTMPALIGPIFGPPLGGLHHDLRLMALDFPDQCSYRRCRHRARLCATSSIFTSSTTILSTSPALSFPGSPLPASPSGFRQ